jgi:hypothetical protein
MSRPNKDTIRQRQETDGQLRIAVAEAGRVREHSPLEAVTMQCSEDHEGTQVCVCVCDIIICEV